MKIDKEKGPLDTPASLTKTTVDLEVTALLLSRRSIWIPTPGNTLKRTCKTSIARASTWPRGGYTA